MSEARRNQWGQYQVVPPNGGKPYGYTRATTVAKTLDDGGGLIAWKAALTMVGALRRPGLHARWQALHSEYGDPWYASKESKKLCKELVEECATAGGSTDRADLGTAEHAIIEQSLRHPERTPLLRPEMQADIDAFRATIAAAGITFNPEFIEAMVVLDRYKVAGTSDQLDTMVPGYGRMTADLKTGADLKYSWQAIAVQLAIYANADNVYVQGEAADGSQDQRIPMPPISREWGMVIHLPAGEARCKLHLIDLVAGWEAFEHSYWTRSWRTRKDVSKPYVLPAPTLFTAPPDFDTPAASSTIEAGGAGDREALGPDATGLSRPPASSTAPPDFDSPPVVPPRQPPLTQVDEQQQAATGPPPLAPVAPAAPPDFDAPARQTASEILLPESDRDAPTRADQLCAMRTETPDEGDTIDGAGPAAAKAAYEALEPLAREWVTRLASEAIQWGVSFHLKDHPTMRRFEILRGVVSLAVWGIHEPEHLDLLDDYLRELVALAMRSDAPRFPVVKPGHALGALHVSEAIVFAQLCDELIADQWQPVFADDGLMTLVRAA